MQDEADIDCRGGEQTDKDIIERVKSRKGEKEEEEDDEEEEAEEEEFKRITHLEAKTAMQTLARYAIQYGLSTQTQSLDKIEDEFKRTALATMRQAYITSYF